MANEIPEETIAAFARTIHQEAKKYGFGQVDTIRLVNALIDLSMDHKASARHSAASADSGHQRNGYSVDELPLTSSRLRVRLADAQHDVPLLEGWMADEYGRHFLLSCATAQQLDIAALLSNPHNQVGIIELSAGTPIGAIAYLDVDKAQRRAELRKIIGVKGARGKGYAEEATSLWIEYGLSRLGLEKVYVSTLQTHLRNIKLNESVGFRVEGILRGEVRLGHKRHDVLRMGLLS
jgi:RimJ/RimL family protein N-acetyltransferase